MNLRFPELARSKSTSSGSSFRSGSTEYKAACSTPTAASGPHKKAVLGEKKPAHRSAGSSRGAVGDQDHGGVTMPVPARLAGRLHQLLDLGTGEIFPGPGQLRNLSVWRRDAVYRKSHGNPPSLNRDWGKIPIFSSVSSFPVELQLSENVAFNWAAGGCSDARAAEWQSKPYGFHRVMRVVRPGAGVRP